MKMFDRRFGTVIMFFETAILDSTRGHFDIRCPIKVAALALEFINIYFQANLSLAPQSSMFFILNAYCHRQNGKRSEVMACCILACSMQAAAREEKSLHHRSQIRVGSSIIDAICDMDVLQKTCMCPHYCLLCSVGGRKRIKNVW